MVHVLQSHSDEACHKTHGLSTNQRLPSIYHMHSFDRPVIVCVQHVRWGENMARTKKNINASGILVVNLKERDHLENPGVDGVTSK